MMDYVIIFEVTKKGYAWWFPSIGIVILLIGAAFVRTKWKTFGIFLALFALLWSAIAIKQTFLPYREAMSAYLSNNYQVEEGEVRNFHPMPQSEHDEESFTVNGRRFSYSGAITPCYNATAINGGKIRTGMKVKVAFKNNCILSLAVETNAQVDTRDTK